MLSILKVINNYTSDLLSLLETNVIGTPGKSMLYQHKAVKRKLDRIKQKYFVILEHHNKILGTCCLCKRSSSKGDKESTSYYIRYFTFKEKLRSNSDPILKKRVNGNIRNEIHGLLNGEKLEINKEEKTFFYAYVDEKNIRSAALCNEFGFTPVRQFKTFIFSRIFPRNVKSVQKAIPEEEYEIVNLLESFYADYNMFGFENFDLNQFYLLRNDAGEIIAGAQAQTDRWLIKSLPDKLNHILLRLLSIIPFVNNLIGVDFKFLCIDYIFYNKGHTSQLEQLFEGLLFLNKRNTALIFSDSQSELNNAISNINPGILKSFSNSANSSVICKFLNYTTQETEIFKAKPAFISGTDLT